MQDRLTGVLVERRRTNVALFTTIVAARTIARTEVGTNEALTCGRTRFAHIEHVAALKTFVFANTLSVAELAYATVLIARTIGALLAAVVATNLTIATLNVGATTGHTFEEIGATVASFAASIRLIVGDTLEKFVDTFVVFTNFAKIAV